MRVVAGVCDEESAVLLITGVRTVVVLVTAGRDGHTGPVMTVVVLLTTGSQVEQHLSSRLSTSMSRTVPRRTVYNRSFPKPLALKLC